jgi:RNA-directed DNA polymerase
VGITKLQYTTETKLKRIAFLSGKDPHKCFTSLMHHFTEESLKECFNLLDGKKAVGIDGMDKGQYAKDLDKNIRELITRMKRMNYRPGPVKQVQIPKDGAPGATRPLGISNLEDKIIQKMMQRVLESIYEPLFLKCSYGFRVGIGCHDAIKDMHNYLYQNQVEKVIDIDLANYFGTIDRKLLEGMLRKKIKDEKFMRYIIRMFKAGILIDGELTVSEEGVIQGSTCSPILSNIFAHYVIDEWVEREVKPRCVGQVKLYRFCDDAVICCRFEKDAIRIKEALSKRLAKYKLSLNEEKTKLVDFRKRSGTSASFDFLGFTHYLGRSKKGHIIPKAKTIGKRMRSKLRKVSEWARTVRNNMKTPEIWKRFCSKLRGHINYYAISHNGKRVSIFVRQATRILFKWLNRRSQRKSFTWEKFWLYVKANPLPEVKICHKLF